MTTIQGAVGTVTAVEIPQANPAAVAVWFIEIPGLHAFWKGWALSIVHLRDLPGIPAAEKKYPQAEYELFVYALDPQNNPGPDNATEWKMLTPLNVAEQFHGVTDTQAKAIAHALAYQVANGRMIPEPQGIQGAREMWRDAIRNQIEIEITVSNQSAIGQAAKDIRGEA